MGYVAGAVGASSPVQYLHNKLAIAGDVLYGLDINRFNNDSPLLLCLDEHKYGPINDGLVFASLLEEGGYFEPPKCKANRNGGTRTNECTRTHAHG